MQYYSSKTVNLHAIERVDTAIISDVDSELSVRTPSVCYRTIAYQPSMATMLEAVAVSHILATS